MKLALLSDIHGNYHALQACLAHAEAAGAQQYAVLGDLVGYGAHPAEVVRWAMGVAASGGIVLRGNHDDAASVEEAPVGESAEHASVQWTRSRLNAELRSFLADCPLMATWGDLLLVHASAHDPRRWIYVDRPERARQCLEAAEALHGLQRVCTGHVHEQRLFYPGRRDAMMAFDPTAGIAIPLRAHRRWVATVGSVGQPRDGDPRAMYALFDPEENRLTYQRVPYDHAAASEAIRETPLPSDFARRLGAGR